MKTRIKSVSEFKEKIGMAQQLGNLILSKKATPNDVTVYDVMMSEIKEYTPVFMKKAKL
jgi:hypothetical protein